VDYLPFGAGSSRAYVASQVLHSSEFELLWVANVNSSYLGYFDSTSSDVDLEINNLASSGSFLETEWRALSSTGYYDNAGANNADYVIHLYRDVVMRDPTSPELWDWVVKLNSGWPRAYVAVPVLRTAEASNLRVAGPSGRTTCLGTSLSDPAGATAGSYCIVLDRMADSGGQAYWANILQNNGELPDLWADLMGSVEYFNKANHEIESPNLDRV